MPAEWTSGFGTGPPRPPTTDGDLRCSFCGKPQTQVRKLIAGPNRVAICNECVALCGDIITDDHPRTPDTDIPA